MLHFVLKHSVLPEEIPTVFILKGGEFSQQILYQTGFVSNSTKRKSPEIERTLNYFCRSTQHKIQKNKTYKIMIWVISWIHNTGFVFHSIVLFSNFNLTHSKFDNFSKNGVEGENLLNRSWTYCFSKSYLKAIVPWLSEDCWSRLLTSLFSAPTPIPDWPFENYLFYCINIADIAQYMDIRRFIRSLRPLSCHRIPFSFRSTAVELFQIQ